MKNAFALFSLLSCLSLLSLTSCAVYNQEFDDLPPIGVPGISVTDLESRVIETSAGPDLFIPIEREVNAKSKSSVYQCQTALTPCDGSGLNRKVWICPHLTEEGCHIQGHYIYQAQAIHTKIADQQDSYSLQDDSETQLIIN